jgi:hypothetical protein
METFIKLFGSLLVFVYHCFDRIVINDNRPKSGARKSEGTKELATRPALLVFEASPEGTGKIREPRGEATSGTASANKNTAIPSKLDSAPVNRLHALGKRIQFDQIIVPHDVQNRHSGAVKQLSEALGLVSLGIFCSLKPIGTNQQIAGESDHIDKMLSGHGQQPFVDRLSLSLDPFRSIATAAFVWAIVGVPVAAVIAAFRVFVWVITSFQRWQRLQPYSSRTRWRAGPLAILGWPAV